MVSLGSHGVAYASICFCLMYWIVLYSLDVAEHLWIAELMGGILSKRASSRQASTSYSRSNPQPSYVQPNQEFMPYQQYTPAPPSYGGRAPDSERRLDRKYSKIDDNYNSLEQVSHWCQRSCQFAMGKWEILFVFWSISIHYQDSRISDGYL